MKTAAEIHKQAMDHFEASVIASDPYISARELEAAYKLERSAAELLASRRDDEPSRSILYRSAASLALQCGRPVEAIDLVVSGLQGNPPAAIRAELIELLGAEYDGPFPSWAIAALRDANAPFSQSFGRVLRADQASVEDADRVLEALKIAARLCASESGDSARANLDLFARLLTYPTDVENIQPLRATIVQVGVHLQDLFEEQGDQRKSIEATQARSSLLDGLEIGHVASTG